MHYRIRMRMLKWYVDCFDESGALSTTLGPYDTHREAVEEAERTGYMDGDR